jgi:hypothetical protein
MIPKGQVKKGMILKYSSIVIDKPYELIVTNIYGDKQEEYYTLAHLSNGLSAWATYSNQNLYKFNDLGIPRRRNKG